VGKAEWGEKRTCPRCGVRFYDLRRIKIICPKCDAPYKEAPTDDAGDESGEDAKVSE